MSVHCGERSWRGVEKNLTYRRVKAAKDLTALQTLRDQLPPGGTPRLYGRRGRLPLPCWCRSVAAGVSPAVEGVRLAARVRCPSTTGGFDNPSSVFQKNLREMDMFWAIHLQRAAEPHGNEMHSLVPSASQCLIIVHGVRPKLHSERHICRSNA